MHHGNFRLAHYSAYNNTDIEYEYKFMNKSVKIKVIKKGETKIIETLADAMEPHEPHNAAKLALRVSGWITEFQMRRREETESAIRRFSA